MTHWVIALWSEAKPLIARLGLSAVGDGGPFRHHRGDGHSLVVSGIGKSLAAAATGYLFAAEGSRRDRSWINFGIAGHAELPVGTALLAHKVEDAGNGRVWYPCPVFDLPVASAVVRTVDRPTRDYPPEAACEMEAAGFAAVASRFTSSELFQVVKVISDGPDTDLGDLSARRVTELTALHVATLVTLAAELSALADEVAAARPRVDPQPWLERWRFTVSQRRRLEKLLARFATVAARPAAPADLGPAPVDAKAVLAGLEEAVHHAWSAAE